MNHPDTNERRRSKSVCSSLNGRIFEEHSSPFVCIWTYNGWISTMLTRHNSNFVVIAAVLIEALLTSIYESISTLSSSSNAVSASLVAISVAKA